MTSCPSPRRTPPSRIPLGASKLEPALLCYSLTIATRVLARWGKTWQRRVVSPPRAGRRQLILHSSAPCYIQAAQRSFRRASIRSIKVINISAIVANFAKWYWTFSFISIPSTYSLAFLYFVFRHPVYVIYILCTSYTHTSNIVVIIKAYSYVRKFNYNYYKDKFSNTNIKGG